MGDEKLTLSGTQHVESQKSSPGKAAESGDQSLKDQPLKRRKRAFIVDAATMPTPIDVEEEVACVRRELPPVDAAKSPDEHGDALPDTSDHVQDTLAFEDELVDVVDIPEPTLEEELLKEVGLDIKNVAKGSES